MRLTRATDPTRWEPLLYTHVSEAACLYADRFWAAADKASTKNCQTGTSPIYQSRSVKQVKYRWTTVKKRFGKKLKPVRAKKRIVVNRIVRVKIADEPVYSVCSDWHETLFALQTFPHETMHLMGITSESIAECYGMQLLARTAIQFGATPDFARELAADYAAAWYVPTRGTYSRRLCRRRDARSQSVQQLVARRVLVLLAGRACAFAGTRSPDA